MTSTTTINDRAERAYAQVLLMHTAAAGQVSGATTVDAIALLRAIVHELAGVREDLYWIVRAGSQAQAPTDDERAEMTWRQR